MRHRSRLLARVNNGILRLRETMGDDRMKYYRIATFFVLFMFLGGFASPTTAKIAASSFGGKVLDVDVDALAPAGAAKLEKEQYIVIRRGPNPRPGPEDDFVQVLDRRGNIVFQRSPGLDLHGASLVNVLDATLRSSDRLVVSVFVRNDTNQNAAVLVEYNLTNSELVRIVRTYPIQCQSLASDNEDIVWCAGFDSPKVHAGEFNYDLVYRFDRRGKVLSTSLPRSSFPETPPPMMGSGRDRFGFLPGKDGVRHLLVPSTREIVIFNSDGDVAGRMKLPDWPNSENLAPDTTFPRYAVTSDGIVVATLWTAGDIENPKSLKQYLFRLAQDGQNWVPLEDGPITIPTSAHLLGAVDSGLVFFDRASQKLISLPVETAPMIDESPR